MLYIWFETSIEEQVMNGTFSIMRPLRDEDKWFHMTKKQLISVIISGILIKNELKVMFAMHLKIVGIILAVLIAIADIALFLITIQISYDNYMVGGGLTPGQFIRRYLYRKLPSNKVIFTKCVPEKEAQVSTVYRFIIRLVKSIVRGENETWA